MNTIETIILTVLANAIVTGIIVYLIQKKIESSFAKKMEEFRANLQYSNFEQQTKFVRSHEKRVATLESLHEKYLVFVECTLKEFEEADTFYFGDREKDFPFDEIDFEDPFRKLEDFRKYLGSNRHYLPDDIVEGIENIHRNSLNIILVVVLALVSDNNKTQGSKDFISVNQMIKTNRLNISRISSKTPNIRKVLKDAKKEVNNQALEVERFYRLVADTKH